MDKIREQLREWLEFDYESMIKALLSIESGCDDSEKLDKVYQMFMRDDNATLLNENLMRALG